MKTTPQNRSLRSRFRGDPGMKTTHGTRRFARPSAEAPR
jgi:hypothetical protein